MMRKSEEAEDAGSLGARSGEEASQGDPALTRIEARLDRIEKALDRFSSLADQIPGLTAMGVDIADEWATKDGRVDDRRGEALALVNRLTRPEVLQSMQTLLRQLEAAPGLFAMLGDMVDDLARRAEEEGADLHGATANLFDTLMNIVKLLGQPETRELLESGVLSPGAVRSMNMAARALAEAGTVPTERVGLFAAFSKTRDPDVQRALSFMLNTAKTLGRALGDTEQLASTPPQLTAHKNDAIDRSTN